MRKILLWKTEMRELTGNTESHARLGRSASLRIQLQRMNFAERVLFELSSQAVGRYPLTNLKTKSCDLHSLMRQQGSITIYMYNSLARCELGSICRIYVSRA